MTRKTTEDVDMDIQWTPIGLWAQLGGNDLHKSIHHGYGDRTWPDIQLSSRRD